MPLNNAKVTDTFSDTFKKIKSMILKGKKTVRLHSSLAETSAKSDTFVNNNYIKNVSQRNHDFGTALTQCNRINCM